MVQYNSPVVEWIQSNSFLEYYDPDAKELGTYRWIDELEWQAKLKEWGIEEYPSAACGED